MAFVYEQLDGWLARPSTCRVEVLVHFSCDCKCPFHNVWHGFSNNQHNAPAHNTFISGPQSVVCAQSQSLCTECTSRDKRRELMGGCSRACKVLVVHDRSVRHICI